MRHKFIFVFIILIISITGFTNIPEKNILVLNSYHHGFPWTDELTYAIEKSLTDSRSRIEFYYEYLDRKRFSEKSYMTLLTEFYQRKYRGKKIDLIIATDDDALTLLRENEKRLFGSIPVVYTGINDLSIPEILNGTRYTGVLEETPPDGTLKLALTLHPSVKHIYVLADYTSIGRMRYKNLKTISGKYPGINFEFSPDTTIDEIKKRLSMLDKRSLVLLLAYFNDSAGRFFNYENLMKEIYPVLSVPVYCVSGNFLGLGITGGVVNSAEVQGREAAQIAARILNGEKPENIPGKRDIQLRTVIDYKEIERSGISKNLIPADSVIINRPRGFYDFYRDNMILFLVLLLLSFTVVIAVLIAGRYKILRINNKRLKVISELKVALDEVTALQGLLPICSGCKNIRNDKGYWEKIETYVSDHSGVTFTHSLCPDCIKKYYPEYNDEKKLP